MPSELDEVDVVKAGADEDGFDVSGEGSRGVSRGIGRRGGARGVDGGGEEEILAAFVREAEPAADALVGGGARVVVEGGRSTRFTPASLATESCSSASRSSWDEDHADAERNASETNRSLPPRRRYSPGRPPRLQGRAVAGTRGDGDVRRRAKTMDPAPVGGAAKRDDATRRTPPPRVDTARKPNKTRRSSSSTTVSTHRARAEVRRDGVRGVAAFEISRG